MREKRGSEEGITVGNTFEDEMKKLGQVEAEVRAGGTTELFDELQKKLEKVSEPWENLYAEGELLEAELIRLTDGKDILKEYIRKLKELKEQD
jgi:hypothetical protein